MDIAPGEQGVSAALHDGGQSDGGVCRHMPERRVQNVTLPVSQSLSSLFRGSGPDRSRLLKEAQ